MIPTYIFKDSFQVQLISDVVLVSSVQKKNS